MNDRNELLNDYLLGELTPERRAQLEHEIAADPELAAEIAQLSPLVAELEELPGEAWQQPELPPLRIGGDDHEKVRAKPAPARRRSLGARWSLRPALAGVAALAIFAVGIGVGWQLEGQDPAAPPVTAQQAATLKPVGQLDPKANGSAAVRHGGHSIKLRLHGLAPNTDKDFYEAWLMDQTNGFVSLGTFRVGADGAVTLDLPVAVGTDRFPVVDISLQPVNGKPEHSGVSVLRGELAS